MKKLSFCAIIIFCSVLVIGSVFAADENKAVPAATANVKNPPANPQMPGMPAGQRPMKSNFGIVMGTITKINNADPANTTLEVKNSVDNKEHTLSVTPWTNVTKVTDLSELKVGDSVRVMSRTNDNKETAMAVMFGKIQNRPMPRPLAQGGAAEKKLETAPVKK